MNAPSVFHYHKFSGIQALQKLPIIIYTYCNPQIHAMQVIAKSYLRLIYLSVSVSISKPCPDTIDFRMQRLFSTASSVIVADITIGSLEGLESLEVHNQ